MINRLNITPKEINKTCPAGSGEGCPARSEKPENMFEEKKNGAIWKMKIRNRPVRAGFPGKVEGIRFSHDLTNFGFDRIGASRFFQLGTLKLVKKRTFLVEEIREKMKKKLSC